MGIIGNPAIQALIGSAHEHYAAGNRVCLVTTTRTGDDPDVGIAGTAATLSIPISPEPMINGMSIDAVIRSGNAFKFSDMRLSVAKPALTDDQALSSASEFTINGILFEIRVVTPELSTWEFVIRRKVQS